MYQMNRSARIVVTWGMMKGLPGRLLPIIVPTLLAAAQFAAGQTDQEVGQVRTSTAAIRGTVSIHPAEDTPHQHARDLMREMYATKHAPDDSITNESRSGEDLKPSERAVIYLEGSALDRQTFHVPERHPVLNQRNLEFHPRTLPILVGATVDFPNRDNLFHNVFSYSQTKEFDLGRYPRNDSRSVTFDQPGIVRVYCDIHSHMSATILVLRNPYFTVVSDNGSYVIQHIPEGKYTLVFWYDRDVVERRPVELKAGETLEVNFTY